MLADGMDNALNSKLIALIGPSGGAGCLSLNARAAKTRPSPTTTLRMVAS